MPRSLAIRRLAPAAFAAMAAFAGGPNAAATLSGRVVDAQGKGIAEAVVFVQASTTIAPGGGRRTAVMDQVNKAFVPGVLPIVVGTTVQFPNNDQIHHHVYSFSRTKNFELPLYKGSDAPPVHFDKAGVVQIGCNIHDWMSAVILVLPNAHFALTDESGRFTLEDLPAGRHTLAAWHARARTPTEDTLTEVAAADGSELLFKLTLAPPRARPAVRGSRWNP